MLPQLWLESLNTCGMQIMHMHHNPKGPFHTHVENLRPSLAAILARHVFCSGSNGNCVNSYGHCFACQHNSTSRADIFEGCECACEVAKLVRNSLGEIILYSILCLKVRQLDS